MLDFSQADHIWLASYPRSGSTLLRTILFQCFGLKSASIYQGEFSENAELAGFVGHLEHDSAGVVNWPPGVPQLIKTHGCSGTYAGPAIYAIRNGHDAVRSGARFYRNALSIEDIIKGKQPFDLWSKNVSFWTSKSRGPTLLLRYEDMVNDMESSLSTLSNVLGRPILSHSLPDRDVMADQFVVNSETDRPPPLTTGQKDLFQWINGSLMREFGYGE